MGQEKLLLTSLLERKHFYQMILNLEVIKLLAKNPQRVSAPEPAAPATVKSSKSSGKASKAVLTPAEPSISGFNEILQLSYCQIEGLGDYGSYVQALLPYRGIDLSGNYITKLPVDFAQQNRFQEVLLNENSLENSENIDGNLFLRRLDLGFNQLKKISLLSNLPELRSLRLAGNNITRLENLDLPLLEELDISHNQIRRLENMERLVSLKILNIAKNQLGDLDYLLVLGETKMQEIDFSYNRLPVSYLDQLLEILTALKTLRRVTFTGNELALNKF